MSFGFSVGDFFAAANLINEVVSALREAGGSGFQYQRLTLELHSLRLVLAEVDRLMPAEGLESMVEAIKATALSCQLPLRDFLQKIEGYDKSLGLGKRDGVMRDVLCKIKWAASKKMEASLQLRVEVTAYIGGINLLLGLYQVSVSQPLKH